MSYCVYWVVPPPALQRAIAAEWRMMQERVLSSLTTDPECRHITRRWCLTFVLESTTA